jgi:hypothetical protein
MNELIERFQDDHSSAGFYGIRIPMGEVNGLNMSLVIENQKELVIGIQPEDSPVPTPGVTMDTFREIMFALMSTGRSWDFEAPGWIAWKTTDIRLNFRSLFNKAFQDILLRKSNSEALYLIVEEIRDILDEVREVLINQKVEYGAFIN